MSAQGKSTRLGHLRRALRYWDPIGVIENNESGDSLGDDEYDSYSKGLLSAIEAGADSYKLARHLAMIRSVSMCIGDRKPTERESDLAEKFVRWRKSGFREVPDFRFDRYAI